MLQLLKGQDEKAYDAAAVEAGIPRYMADTVRLYVEERIAPGDFLLAVLSNDLVGSVARADDHNARSLRGWMLFLTWCLPHNCWGSAEVVKSWLAARRDAESVAEAKLSDTLYEEQKGA